MHSHVVHAGSAQKLALPAVGRRSLPLRSHTVVRAAASASRERVLEAIAMGTSLYTEREDTSGMVGELIQTNQIPNDRLAEESLGPLGQGTWEVWWAPHISSMSKVLATRFEPIRYTLAGDKLTSNVQARFLVGPPVWLSAGGTLKRKFDDVLEVTFDRFWIDIGNTPRADIGPSSSSSGEVVDKLIGAVGRAAFFPSFALFPVKYLDDEGLLACFEFPPLRSLIAVRKVAGDSNVPAIYTPPYPAPGSQAPRV